MYLYGEGLVSCKNLFPIQLYIYIDNNIIIEIMQSDTTMHFLTFLYEKCHSVSVVTFLG